MNQYDYIDAGLRVFGLYGATPEGRCECGDPDCQALYKHPRISNWPSTPAWSDEQLETMEAMEHFATGFGVLAAGHLIIDVDARNGGVESFARLVEAVPAAGRASLVVNTGSGGGSQHHYFTAPGGVAMVQHLKQYPGIDFKTSGFVVGAGSLHASGNVYSVERGHPADVGPAPTALVDLLRKPSTYRTHTSSGTVDITPGGIAELLNYINNSPGIEYEDWIRVGMAIHHTTGGSADGFALWDTWSRDSDKYSPAQMEKKWHSFGKAAQPVTIGTLYHMAHEGGYEHPIEFAYTQPVQDDPSASIDTSGVDSRRPPGTVGEITQWINDQCRYPRESMAVAAALTAVGNLAGMRIYDAEEDMTANLLAFCVGGSGTGKEAVQQAFLQIIKAAGVAGAVHGAFKSEQEVIRNLTRHQAAFYWIDELGIVLRKLQNASRGGATYLEGVVGIIMSIYSKANGYLPITGDLKESIKQDLIKELGSLRKKMDDAPGSDEGDKRRAIMEQEEQRLTRALDTIEVGLENPFLSIIGWTTPTTFDGLMDMEQATSGFLARALVFRDLETNPRRKSKFQKRPMPDSLKYQLANLYRPGCFDALESGARVEHEGDKSPVRTEPDAMDMLDIVYEEFHAMAEEQKSSTGLEALPRRGYEMTSKLSLILAIPDGMRTVEHVRWAYKVARDDCLEKIRMVYANDREEDPTDSRSAYAAKVLALVKQDHGETFGVIRNRLRKVPKEALQSLLGEMVEQGALREEVTQHPTNKREVCKYFATGD